MEKNKIQMWIWVIIAIIIAVIIFFMFGNKIATSPTTTVNPPVIETKSVQNNSNKTDTIGGTEAMAISYADALIKYANRRIQIDTECRAYPSNITYKDNTGIMIDNRSPKTRTVKVGTTFIIKPWGFKIVVLPDVYLASKTLLVDCDGSQNIATILVQE